MTMRTDVRGAIRNLLREVQDGDAEWDDLAYGFVEGGQTMTYAQAVNGLCDLLAKGQRFLPDCRRSPGVGKEPPWGELDPGVVELVRLLWDEGFEPTDSGDGISKIGGPMDDGDGSVIPRIHVAVVVDRLDLLVETDRLMSVLERSGRPIDPMTAWHVEGTYAGGDDALIMVWGPET